MSQQSKQGAGSQADPGPNGAGRNGDRLPEEGQATAGSSSDEAGARSLRPNADDAHQAPESGDKPEAMTAPDSARAPQAAPNRR